MRITLFLPLKQGYYLLQVMKAPDHDQFILLANAERA